MHKLLMTTALSLALAVGYFGAFANENEAGLETALDGSVNVASAFDINGPKYVFKGSLTTPPYSEQVKWFVVEHQKNVSKLQIAKFVSVIGYNFRPTQPLNGRVFGSN